MDDSCLYCNLGDMVSDKPRCMLGLDSCERCTYREPLDKPKV